MPGDEGVERVEVLLGHAVHLGDPAAGDHQPRLRVGGRTQRDQAQGGVLDREPVQVDPLLVHEPDRPTGGPADSVIGLLSFPGGLASPWIASPWIASPWITRLDHRALCGRSSMTRPGGAVRAAASPGRAQPGRAQPAVLSPGARSPDHDADPVAAEQVVGVLERRPAGVGRGPADGQQRRARGHVQDRRLVLRRGDHLDALDRFPRAGAEVLVEQLVGDPPSGSSSRPGKRSAGSMTCSTEMGLPSASRIRTRSMTRSPRRIPSARAAGSSAPDSPALITRVPATTPWLRSRAGTPTTRDSVPLDLVLADESAAAPAGTRRTTPLSPAGQGLAQRGPADPRSAASAAPRRAAGQGAGDRRRSARPGRGARPRASAGAQARSWRERGGQQAARPARDSGSTWPPSTTMVWPVM